MLFYQTLAFTIYGKIYTKKSNNKSQTKTMNLKYQLQHGMKNFNYLMDHILYKILKITLNIS